MSQNEDKLAHITDLERRLHGMDDRNKELLDKLQSIAEDRTTNASSQLDNVHKVTAHKGIAVGQSMHQI